MLSYHDVVLYASDVALLQGPYWLNDQIMTFYYEYLTHEVVRDKDVAFLSPAQAFLMMYGELNDVVECLVKPMELTNKELIFLPVNDNPDVERAEGGKHWSLLIWDGRCRAFLHLDSCARLNTMPARKMAAKLFEAVGEKGDMKMMEPDVLRQRNAYDCALYVMIFSRVLAERRSEWDCEKLHVLRLVRHEDVTRLRMEMLDLIETKRREGA